MVDAALPTAVPSQIARYWRMRMKYDEGDDVTKAAWRADLIGVWYGGWNADQFERTLEHDTEDAAAALSKFNDDAGLGWKVKSRYVDTARRFWGISNDDWVFTYFDDAIHLARVESLVERQPHPTFSRGLELFKFRRIGSKKMFSLGKLPDCFRLLSSAGQGNVHEVGATRRLVKLLAESTTEQQVCEKFQGLSWDEWLDALGPHGWEALCLGYLILEVDFVPTGLDVGYTLPLFDLIGKNRAGHRIYAQCKKNPGSMCVDDDLAQAFGTLASSSSVYLFAYGGCSNITNGVMLLTGADLRQWFSDSDKGKNYMHLLRT